MRINLLFCLLLIPFLMQAQDEWEFELPGLTNHHSFISKLITTSDGGYLAVREVWTDSDGDGGYFTVIKLNETGVIEWEEPFEIEGYRWGGVRDLIEEEGTGFTFLIASYLFKINSEGSFISSDTIQNISNFGFGKFEKLDMGYRFFGSAAGIGFFDFNPLICDYSDSLTLVMEYQYPAFYNPMDVADSSSIVPAWIVDFEHTDDGGYILAVNNNYPFDDTEYVAYAMKLDSDLTEEWQRNTRTVDNDRHGFTGVEVLDNGDFVFGGAESFGSYVAQFTSAGELVGMWNGNPASFYFADVDRNDQGDVLMVGSRVEFAPMNPFKASLGFLHEGGLALYEESSIPYDHGYAVVGNGSCFVIGGIKDKKAYLSKQCNLINANESIEKATSFSIHPNPSAGLFFIENANAFPLSTSVKVFNNLGTCVLEQQLLKNDWLDLSAQPSGIYYVQFNDGFEVLESSKVMILR